MAEWVESAATVFSSDALVLGVLVGPRWGIHCLVNREIRTKSHFTIEPAPLGIEPNQTNRPEPDTNSRSKTSTPAL